MLTGAESTGKSTLAGRLASHFSAPVSPEFARTFVDQHTGELTARHVPEIAHGQLKTERDLLWRAAGAGCRLVIKDTDLISTVVYANHYFGHCPRHITSLARQWRGDLYLHLGIDVPWVADGRQRALPARREALDRLFRDTLAEFAVRTHAIAGSWQEREEAAIAAIEGLLR